LCCLWFAFVGCQKREHSPGFDHIKLMDAFAPSEMKVIEQRNGVLGYLFVDRDDCDVFVLHKKDDGLLKFAIQEKNVSADGHSAWKLVYAHPQSGDFYLYEREDGRLIKTKLSTYEFFEKYLYNSDKVIETWKSQNERQKRSAHELWNLTPLRTPAPTRILP